MPVYRLLVEYDGTAFHGWQAQSAVPTVQGEIERALAILARSDLRTVAAGRTDRGVHARGQVASFRIDEPVPCARWSQGLNGICSPDVRVHRLEEAPPGFHARHHARWRLYQYRISLHRCALDRDRAWSLRRAVTLPRLRDASRPLLGRHDFSAFANQSPDDPDPICHLAMADWSATAEGFLLTVRSDRFLYKMVRTIAATLVREAGTEGGGADAIARILAGRDRRLAAPPAPAGGLTLVAVGYDPPWPDPHPFASSAGLIS